MGKTLLIVLILLIVILYVSLLRKKVESFVSMKQLYDKAAKPYTVDRLKHCMSTYPSDSEIQLKPMKTKYWNKYYKKYMDLKLCDFYIAGSYRTYAPCGYTMDIQSYDAIKRALLMGARVLTFDLYSNDDLLKPQIEIRVEKVLNKKQGAPLNFRKVCETIKGYGWLHVNYPLIVYFNMHFKDRILYQEMARTLLDVMPERLAHKRYGFKRYNIAQIPVKELMGTMLIMTSKYPNDGMLDELTNEAIAEKHESVTLKEYTDGMMTHGGINAVETDLMYLINYNKFNMTMYYHGAEKKHENVLSPKEDVNNYNSADTRKYGAQIALMYYQKDDPDMREYLDFFKECSFVVKPDKLRYIPKPKKPVDKQDKRLYYGPNKHVFPGMNGHPWIELTY